MRVVAFDCGTRTGWAVGDEYLDGRWDVMESGVQVFDLRRGESPGLRFMRFRTWLGEMALLWMPDLAVYELAHHRGGAATELSVGMTTRVQEWAASRGIEHASVHTGTLKKFATGNGGAGKPAMMQRASEIVGRPVVSDDEADAICLLAYGFETYAGAMADVAGAEQNGV